jgi:phenylacetate-CoA ligase
VTTSLSSRHGRPSRPLLVWPDFMVGGSVFLQRLVAGLEASQTWPADRFSRGQAKQLASLLRWAAESSPYYQNLGMRAKKLAPLTEKPAQFWEQWRALPLLTKATLRTKGASLHARFLPPDQLPIETTLTSGSTGIPVEVRTTQVTRQLWEALTLREHLWQGRDFSKRLGIIRYRLQAERDPMGTDLPSWGSPVAKLYSTGPASVIHNGLPIRDYVAWLRRFDPHYLLTYPSIMAELMHAMEGASGKPSSLEEIRFIAEPLDRALEERLVSEWGVRTTDMYSANEVGHIAFRCPEHGKLHVQAETILVEILDENGLPCAPGQQGRVVVTPLHNFATPLIRYELGDYATPGEPCACGRSLPVIEKVLGRVRNLLRTPDGDALWPVGFALLRSVTPIRQSQWVQTKLDTIQLRVVLERPLSESEKEEATRCVRHVLGYPFEVEIARVDQIERGPTGKFEEFLSLLAP